MNYDSQDCFMKFLVSEDGLVNFLIHEIVL